MKRKKYTYIPKDEIESITTWSGKNITQEKILDGAYVRGNVKYAKGGCTTMADGGMFPSPEHVCMACPIEQVVKYLQHHGFEVEKIGDDRYELYNTVSEFRKGGFDNRSYGTTPNTPITYRVPTKKLRQFAMDYDKRIHSLFRISHFGNMMADGGMMAKGSMAGEKYVVEKDKDGTYKILNTEKNMYVDHTFETKASADSWKESRDYLRKTFGREYADGGMMARGGENDYDIMKGGVSHYSVDIDLDNGEFIRDLEFNKLDKAKEVYEKYSKSMVYKGEPIEDIQLIKVLKNGDYESIGGMMADGGMAHGGETENYLYSVWVDGGEYNDSYLKSLEDAIDLAKHLEYEDYENIVIERLNLDKSHNKWIENWESDDEYADGGETEGIYTKSVEEQAQEMLGSRFYELNPQEREDIINSFIADGVIIPKVTYTQFEEEDFEYADGGGVATATYKVVYQMLGSKDKKEKFFTDKSKAEFFVETMEEDEDVKSVKLEELKPEKPAKASKIKAEPTIDIFGAAKKVTTTAASKTRKPTVEIDGIGDDIERYNELKAIMDNAKAEIELIGGRIREAGLEKYIEMYEQTGRNPPNFDILSGGNSILFMVYDAYVKKISPEYREMLEQYGDGLLEVTKTYEFDTATLDKEVKGGKTVGDIIKELIGKSTDISQEDKMKLLKVKEDVKIPKGTIDRLADYGVDNIQEIFNLIQPTLALK